MLVCNEYFWFFFLKMHFKCFYSGNIKSIEQKIVQLLYDANGPAEPFISVGVSGAGLCTLIITEIVNTELGGAMFEAVWLHRRLFGFKEKLQGVVQTPLLHALTPITFDNVFLMLK